MVRQIDWNPATEHFVPHAVVSRSPSWFEAEKGILFTEGLDGLDYYRAALCSMDDGTPFMLRQYYRNDPTNTTITFEPFIHGLDWITKAVEEIVFAFGLTASDVVWQRKDNPEA
jgi:hypothetical protein